VADLAQLSLSGAAVSGAFDTVTFTTPDDKLYGMGADSVFCLSLAWQAAEFNIFGEWQFNRGQLLRRNDDRRQGQRGQRHHGRPHLPE
jgi:hypothetical protein